VTGMELKKIMKRSLNSSEGKISFPGKLVFPDNIESIAKTWPVTLEEIIRSSEEMLPFENLRRKRSEAASYTPFTLK
jgi:hypothetical protein